jgi:hypothetical protein
LHFLACGFHPLSSGSTTIPKVQFSRSPNQASPLKPFIQSLHLKTMEASTLVKFFAAAGMGYVFLLGTIAGAIPHTIAVAGLVAAWFVGRQAGS